MTVYFDMDRVLTDFAAQAEKYGILKRNKRINWIKVFLLGSSFWSTMDYFPGAKESFVKIRSYCKANDIQVKILSSVRIASGKKGKINWCKNKLFLDSNDIIIVKKAWQKADFGTPDALLIDDNEENIHAFITRGGYGFKFSIWNEGTFNAVMKLIQSIHLKEIDFDKQ